MSEVQKLQDLAHLRADARMSEVLLRCVTLVKQCDHDYYRCAAVVAQTTYDQLCAASYYNYVVYESLQNIKKFLEECHTNIYRAAAHYPCGHCRNCIIYDLKTRYEQGFVYDHTTRSSWFREQHYYEPGELQKCGPKGDPAAVGYPKKPCRKPLGVGNEASGRDEESGP